VTIDYPPSVGRAERRRVAGSESGQNARSVRRARSGAGPGSAYREEPSMRTTTSHQQADAPSLSGHDRRRDVICSLPSSWPPPARAPTGSPALREAAEAEVHPVARLGRRECGVERRRKRGVQRRHKRSVAWRRKLAVRRWFKCDVEWRATSPPVNTGGSSSMPGTGGSAGAVGGGGSSGVSSGSSSGGAAGGKGGSASGSGGAGGSSGGSLSGGSGAAGGKGGSASGGGGTSGSGGVGATGGTTSTALVIPPVRDTASKVPISSPPHRIHCGG